MPKDHFSIRPRDDLAYSPYAVALGYEIRDRYGDQLKPEKFSAGIDGNEHTFHLTRNGASIHVWNTSRGWRVAKLDENGHYPKALASDFHGKLLDALHAGVKVAEAFA